MKHKNKTILFIDETNGNYHRGRETYEDNFCSFKNCKNKPISKLLYDISNLEDKNFVMKIELYKLSSNQIIGDICHEHFVNVFTEYFPMLNIYSIEDEYLKYLFNKTYLILDNNSDLLIKSFKKININKDLENRFTNEEVYIFTDPNYYSSIPYEWKENYVVKEYIGTTTKQGNYNGPDYILEDNRSGRLIGLEIVTINKSNYLISDKCISTKNIKKWYIPKSYKEYIDEIKKLISTKENKIKGYKRCDEYNLAFVLNNSIFEWEYFLYEKLFNHYSKNFKLILFC